MSFFRIPYGNPTSYVTNARLPNRTHTNLHATIHLHEDKTEIESLCIRQTSTFVRNLSFHPNRLTQNQTTPPDSVSTSEIYIHTTKNRRIKVRSSLPGFGWSTNDAMSYSQSFSHVPVNRANISRIYTGSFPSAWFIGSDY